MVIGGCALVLHGVASECGDLDIVPDPDAGNLRTLRSALNALGASRMSGAALTAAVVSLDSPYGRIDVMMERARDEYPALAAAAVTCRVEDAEVRVAAVDDVMRLRARFREVVG